MSKYLPNYLYLYLNTNITKEDKKIRNYIFTLKKIREQNKRENNNF